MSKSLTPFLPVFNFTYSVETSSSNSNCVWALIKTSSSFINLEILLLGKSAFRSAVFLWYIFLNYENNSEEISASVSWLSYHAGSILGLLPNDESIIDEINQKNAAKSAISDIVNDLLKQRTIARDNKNWQRADEIRSELNEMGVIVEDSPDGPIWRIK